MSLYQKFYTETLDEAGRLVDIDIHYPDNFNFGYDVVDALAESHPDERAVVWCNTENEEHIFTFKDISEESNRVANVLLSSGIKKGDYVMVALKRHYEYWFVSVALHKIGAILIPVTHMLTSEDIAYRVQQSKAKAIIATDQNHVPDHIRGALKDIEHTPLLWSVKENVKGFRYLPQEMAQASTELERIDTKATDSMVMYFTSGTSGQPKGVIHDYTYPLAHFVTAKYWQGAREGGLHFTVSETGWAKASWGKLYGQWMNECAVMVFDFDNFEPKQMASVINRYGVTSFCAPPTIYRYMTRKGTTDFPSLEHASTAGEYLSPDVFERFKKATGLDIQEGYGQTETTLLIANMNGMKAKDGSLGKPSPLYDIALISKDGTPTKTGEIGEVCVVPRDGKRPIGVFTAYLDDEERYKNVWRGGVYHTGDAVYMDEEGYYWFHGRFDDIIKTGGYRVGPYEIENELMTHPAVMECSVIGIPDKFRGQSIKAIIVLAPGYEASKELERDIRDYANAQLAEYKWVRMIEFADDMSKTISGKIKKAHQRHSAKPVMA